MEHWDLALTGLQDMSVQNAKAPVFVTVRVWRAQNFKKPGPKERKKHNKKQRARPNRPAAVPVAVGIGFGARVQAM